MHVRKSTMLTASVVTALMATAGLASAAESNAGLASADREFINKAAQGNRMEVAAGKLAAQRALDPAVKQFGQQMIADHTAAADELKKVADLKQMPLTESLPDDEQKALGKLESLNGTDFDKEYSKMMVKDHTTDVSEFKKEANKQSADSDVKAYAQKTLPTLEHHLEMAKRLSSAEKKSP